MNLKVERAMRNLTQVQLAKLAGVDHTTICKIERRGVETVQIQVLTKIAKALGKELKITME